MRQATPRDSRKFLSKRRLAGLVGLSTVVTVGILGMRDLLSPLPRGAFPVLSTVGWTAGGSWSDLDAQVATPPRYLWLANGDLVFLERNAQGMVEVCYRKVSAEGSVGEVRHGPELPTTNQAGPFWGDFFPSPDERWVAYSLDNNPGPNQTGLISADGKTARTLPYEFEAWLSD